jgi:xylulose-5-phosphate/fructose-6-phosphate phosphoketolase
MQSRAAFDNPDVIVAAAVGDGEAETAPLERAWKSISYLNPARDRVVLPILHLNGYKISSPTVLERHETATLNLDSVGPPLYARNTPTWGVWVC